MLQAIYQENKDDEQHKRSRWVSRREKQESKRDAAEKARKEFEITMHLMASLAMSGVDPNPKKKEFDASQYDDEQSLASFELSQRFKKDFPSADLRLSNNQLRDRYRSSSSSSRRAGIKLSLGNGQHSMMAPKSHHVASNGSNPDLRRMASSSSSSSLLRKVHSFHATSNILENYHGDIESMWRDHLGLPGNRNASKSNESLQSAHKQSVDAVRRQRIDIDSVLPEELRSRSKEQSLSSSPPKVNEEFVMPLDRKKELLNGPNGNGLRGLLQKTSLRSFKLGRAGKSTFEHGEESKEFLLQESSSLSRKLFTQSNEGSKMGWASDDGDNNNNDDNDGGIIGSGRGDDGNYEQSGTLPASSFQRYGATTTSLRGLLRKSSLTSFSLRGNKSFGDLLLEDNVSSNGGGKLLRSSSEKSFFTVNESSEHDVNARNSSSSNRRNKKKSSSKKKIHSSSNAKNLAEQNEAGVSQEQESKQPESINNDDNEWVPFMFNADNIMTSDKDNKQEELAQQTTDLQPYYNNNNSSFSSVCCAQSESNLIAAACQGNNVSQDSLSRGIRSRRLRRAVSVKKMKTSTSCSNGSLNNIDNNNKTRKSKTSNVDLLKRWEEQRTNGKSRQRLQRQQGEESQANEIFTILQPSPTSTNPFLNNSDQNNQHDLSLPKSQLTQRRRLERQESPKLRKGTAQGVTRTSSEGDPRRKERTRLRREASAKNLKRTKSGSSGAGTLNNSRNDSNSSGSSYVGLLQQMQQSYQCNRVSAMQRCLSSNSFSRLAEESKKTDDDTVRQSNMIIGTGEELSNQLQRSSSTHEFQNSKSKSFSNSSSPRHRGLRRAASMRGTKNFVRSDHGANRTVHQSEDNLLDILQSSSSSRQLSSNKRLNDSKNNSSFGDISPLVMNQVRW